MIEINAVRYTGNSVVVGNGRVIIDGKDVTDKNMPKTVLEIHVTGTLASLTTDKSVSCDNINGNVIAGGSVNCDDIKGNVYAKGSVNCDDVGGSVRANGSINRG